MLIKTHVGDGAWRLFEAADGLEYLGPHIEVAVPDQHDPSWWEDERFPTDDVGVLHTYTNADPGNRFVRWIKWRDAGDVGHMLITPNPVFVCNDRGDTVEAIR